MLRLWLVVLSFIYFLKNWATIPNFSLFGRKLARCKKKSCFIQKDKIVYGEKATQEGWGHVVYARFLRSKVLVCHTSSVVMLCGGYPSPSHPSNDARSLADHHKHKPSNNHNKLDQLRHLRVFWSKMIK